MENYEFGIWYFFFPVSFLTFLFFFFSKKDTDTIKRNDRRTLLTTNCWCWCTTIHTAPTRHCTARSWYLCWIWMRGLLGEPGMLYYLDLLVSILAFLWKCSTLWTHVCFHMSTNTNFTCTTSNPFGESEIWKEQFSY